MKSELAGAPRTILLLGGTGFIGCNLADELSQAGHRVLATGRTARPLASVASVAMPLGDVDGILSLVAEQRVDTVVHLVSTMIPSSSETHYIDEQHAVVLPTMRLAARLAERSVDFVFISSGGTVYGASKAHFAAERDVCKPISFYGRAKLGLELDVQFLGRSRGLRYLIVRPSNPYGPHQDLQGVQGLISVALGKLREGRPLEVWGDGTSVRDYIHVLDFARSVRELIEGDVRDTIVNVGSGAGHSLIEIVHAIERVTGEKIRLDFRPSRAVDVPRLVLDITRLRSFGMDHARSLEKGISDYVSSLGFFHGRA